jgi:hypothetical protein
MDMRCEEQLGHVTTTLNYLQSMEGKPVISPLVLLR